MTLGAQFAFVGLFFAAGTWHWSDVPWSHFFAALLAVAVYATRFAPPRLTLATAGATGALLGLLSLTRSFEFVAVVLAWGVAAVVLAVLRLASPRTLRLTHVVSGAGAFVVTSALVYLLTGKRELFLLYGNSLGSQSGIVGAGEVAETPTFSFSLVPAKLVQLFVEPCYHALCSLSDYAGGARPLPADLSAGAEAAGNERLWRLPLAVQLPSLVLLPLCVVAVAGIVVWAVRNRTVAVPRSRAIRALIEMTVAATGLVFGYAASTLTGSPHLRYGFARDFLLPSLLSGIVGVVLASAGIWLVLNAKGRGRRLSPEFAFVTLALVSCAAFVFVFAYARANGLPRIESRQLGAVTYVARCTGSSCSISIAARTTSGKSISIPQASTLTFGCGSGVARFTLYEQSLDARRRSFATMPNPRLVAAWPTAMGLPPGSYELAAVEVRNA